MRFSLDTVRSPAPLLIFMMLFAGCGSEEEPPPPPGVLHLEPAAGTTIGARQSLYVLAEHKASASDTSSERLPGDAVTWDSSRPDIATVDRDGTVTGIAAGTAIISARYRGLTNQVPLTVSGFQTTHALQVPGQGLRSYSVWAPEDYAAGAKLPVLIAMHGAGGTARIQASMTLLNATAAQRRALVVYLEGTGLVPTFNAGHCCGYAQSIGLDDVTYVRQVLDDLARHYPVDAARVHATGFSNGGMMSHRLACQLSDRLAGIAAVSGTSARLDGAGNIHYDCTPARPIPILHVHATNDRTVPYQGGPPSGASAPNFQHVETMIMDWVARNNLTTQYLADTAAPWVTCYRYETPLDPALPSAPVVLCRIDPIDVYDPATQVVYGGGHSWPGGTRAPNATSDVPLADFKVNDYLWSFFGN